MEIAIIYLIAMNLLSFACFRSDKKRASFSRYKIGTRTLYVLSFLGGAVGILVGMCCYRSSFNDKSLRYGIPTIFVLQVIIGLLLLL